MNADYGQNPDALRPVPPGGPNRPQYRPPQPTAPRTPDETGLSLVEKLIFRGARGELIQEPWFQKMRRDNQSLVIAGGLTVVVVVSLLLGDGSWTTIAAVFPTLLNPALWLGFGYLMMALATPRAHWFLQWIVCLGGALAGLGGVWSGLAALRLTERVDRLDEVLGLPTAPTGLLVVAIVLNLAAAVLFGYLFVLVRRGLARLAAQR